MSLNNINQEQSSKILEKFRIDFLRSKVQRLKKNNRESDAIKYGRSLAFIKGLSFLDNIKDKLKISLINKDIHAKTRSTIFKCYLTNFQDFD